MWVFLSVMIAILLLAVVVRFCINIAGLIPASRFIYLLVMLVLAVSLALFIGRAAALPDFPL